MKRGTGLALGAALLVTGAALLTPAPPPPLIPDPALTPGLVLMVTAQDVCKPGYAGETRDVSESVKQAVYREYGIKSHTPGEFEVDHLISLELGGSNDIQNLWVQSYKTPVWNAHVKDKLENKLHSLVCQGNLTLTEAQQSLRGDWRIEYVKIFGEPTP